MEFLCNQCVRRLSSRVPLKRVAVPRVARRNRSIPLFKESSFEDLNQVLSTIRSDYFVPAYLTASQRRLIFQQRFKAQIEGGQSSVTIGDEEFVLQPLDSEALARQRRDVVQRAYDLIVENDEWQHLVPLLEGMSRVDNTTTNAALSMLIEKAARGQHFTAIVACLEASKRTGLALTDKWMARSVLRGVRQMVEEVGWTTDALQQAIRCSTQISRLLAREEHSLIPDGTQKHYVSIPLVKDPFVTALWLELRAVKAHGAGQDEDGQVAIYLERLCGQVQPIMSAIEAAKGKSGQDGRNTTDNKQSRTSALQLQQTVTRLESPNFPDAFYPRLSLWQGILLAQKLLGTKDAELEALASRAGAALEKSVEGHGKGAEQRREEFALARRKLGLPVSANNE